jgi:nicotinamide phosphoribosyltransferase
MLANPILSTDSYKLGHWNQYPAGTTGVYSYLEARHGAEYNETVFFGLQSILKPIEGCVVKWDHLSEANALAKVHFGQSGLFNYRGWAHVIQKHGGKLPVRIKAVPEGTPVPAGNVLMTVENTDPECYWLTNALESLLLHVWYPTTVASRSRYVKQLLARALERSGASLDGLPFMLHDFGYRGATTDDAAAIGGAGHLVNFLGTDTLPAMLLAMRDYDADLDSLAFSVPATEHSVMTAEGRAGEYGVVDKLLTQHPDGILSVVADSYNIYAFVDTLGNQFKDRIMARDGVFVVRPDSVTSQDPTPCLLTVHLMERLWLIFGGTTNEKGYRVLDPHVRVLWGDGIDPEGIAKILDRMHLHEFSAENIVFGMGGGLLQKLNRDTQRFAFKSSAQQRNGVWHDVQKQPLDATKLSKAGRLKLVKIATPERPTPHFITLGEDTPGLDSLQPVFENGRILNPTTFAEVRERAAL